MAQGWTTPSPGVGGGALPQKADRGSLGGWLAMKGCKLKVKQLTSRKHSLGRGFTEQIRAVASTEQRGKRGWGQESRYVIRYLWGGGGSRREGFLSSLQAGMGRAPVGCTQVPSP